MANGFNGGASSGGALLWSSAFESERPRVVIQSLQTRIRRDKLVAESLASYLSERANVEEAYVKALAKLQRKPIFADSYGLALGDGLDRIKRRLETELDEILQLHDGFARKVELEVVDVLRDRGAKSGDNALQQHEFPANNVVKGWEDAHTRHTKAQGKASSSSRKGDAAAKVASAQADLNLCNDQWRLNVAPALYQAYDQADRSRLEATKESLAKYATMQSDLGRERLEVAARVLNDVITWELDDDVAQWLRNEGGGTGGLVDGISTSRRGSVSEMGQVRRGGEAYLNPSTAAGRQQGAPPAEPAPSIRSTNRERSGGLFAKLTPKLNRNRSSSHPSAYGNIDAPNDRSSMYEPEPQPEPPTDLGRSVASRPTIADRSDSLDDSAAAASLNSSTGRENRHSFMPSMLRRKNSTSSSQQDGRARSRASMAPGSSLLAPQEGDYSPSASASTTPRPSVVEPPRMSMPAGAAVVRHEVQPSVDAEGYSVPPVGYDKQPWEGAGGSLMDAEPSDDPAGHLRAGSLAIQPITIQESSQEREAALQRVQSQLLSSKTNASPVGRRGTTRGRRDVRVTTFNPLPDDMPLSKLIEQQQALEAGNNPPTTVTPTIISTSPSSSPFNESPFSSPLKTPATHERAMSMLSTSSSRDVLGATGSGASPFEQPHGEGLRASLTETVNVMAKGGDVTRVMVTGEISLSLRAASISGPLRLRLTAYEQLEKSAPNTHYLTPLDNAPGEYTLDAAALASASANGPVAVLRYHLHVPDGSLQHTDLSPVHLHPQWKCEPTTTSILISYRAVATSRLASSSPFDESPETHLRDVTLHVPITSSHVGGVQTKPHGSYASDRRRLAWRLDDLDLASTEVHKVLARLAVNEASAVQPIVLRWRMPGRLVSGVGVEVSGADGEVRLEEVVKRAEGKHLAA